MFLIYIGSETDAYLKGIYISFLYMSNTLYYIFQLHRTYHNKCREMEQQEKQLAVANQSVTISTKENEKVCK